MFTITQVLHSRLQQDVGRITGNDTADNAAQHTENSELPTLKQMDALLADPTKKATFLLKMGLDNPEKTKDKEMKRRLRKKATTYLSLVGRLQVVGLPTILAVISVPSSALSQLSTISGNSHATLR